MREPLESEYFNWLCAKVLDRHTRNTGMYYELLKILYTTEFIWLVPMDGNRAEDGIELREDFSRETNTKRDSIFESQPCSVFEVFLAFAKRASFQNDWPVKNWFWTFMENLQLDQFRHVAEEDVPIIEDILDRFLWRTYDPHGYGGLFPITRTDRDQRKIEIWWQFCEYVQDRGLI